MKRCKPSTRFQRFAYSKRKTSGGRHSKPLGPSRLNPPASQSLGQQNKRASPANTLLVFHKGGTMVVFDVVQIVEPGARTSTRPGRWLVEHHGDKTTAEQRAALMNQCVSVAGISYGVESHDEESSERANYERTKQ